MCLLALAWHDHPLHSLVLAGNRDEAHARPSAAADWWADAPHVLGGRDLIAGGSWLAVSRGGRFAVVTNHRDLRRPPPPDAPSRGALVREFVTGSEPAAEFATRIAVDADRYAGFNLLISDGRALWYASNRAPTRALTPGRYTLANASLDEAWPKTRALRARFDRALAGEIETEDLFAALADRGTHPDAELPDTGLDLARERALSAAHIVTPGYGTRAASVLVQHRDGRLHFTERSFAADGSRTGSRSFELQVGG